MVDFWTILFTFFIVFEGCYAIFFWNKERILSYVHMIFFVAFVFILLGYLGNGYFYVIGGIIFIVGLFVDFYRKKTDFETYE